MEPIVKVDHVSVSYNHAQQEVGVGVKALKNINIEIFPKEYIIFFGPSGCGKSTLMNVIAGLESPTEGTVIVAGRNLSELNDDDLAVYHRHQIGFVFQAYNLIPTLTVLENIALPQMFDGLSKNEWSRNALELAERFGIQDHIQKLPQELSGGQQQRVGVARSLINNPIILLADEPAGNLDSKSAQNVLNTFQELNLREGKTILLVTHSPDNLEDGDRIFYLKDGEIIDEVRNKTRRKRTETRTEQHTAPWKRLFKEAFVPPSLKSEKLTQFILGTPQERKVDRIRLFIEKRIQGIITLHELVSFLNKSYYRGGAGIDKRLATRWGTMIQHVLENAETINKIHVDDEKKIADVIRALRTHLLEMTNVSLTADKEKSFDYVIKDRLANNIGPSQVRKILDIPIKKGGIGLRKQTASKLMNLLELVVLVAAQQPKENEQEIQA